jgi:ribosomal protein L18E
MRAEDLTDPRTQRLIIALWRIIEALETRGVVVVPGLEIEVPDYVPEAWSKSSDT